MRSTYAEGLLQMVTISSYQHIKNDSLPLPLTGTKLKQWVYFGTYLLNNVFLYYN